MNEPVDKITVPKTGGERHPAPPPHRRREVIEQALKLRGSQWTSGLRLMSETHMVGDDLYPVLDKMIGDGVVDFTNVGERQMYRLRHR